MLQDTFHELDLLAHNLLSSIEPSGLVPVDVHREGDRYVIEADVPGVDPESVQVTVEGSALVIRAERSEESTRKDEHWVVRERGTWRCARQFNLDGLDPDRVEATVRDGVLKVVAGISSPGRRKVPVAVGSSVHRELGAAREAATGGWSLRRGFTESLQRLENIWPWRTRRQPSAT